MYFKIFFFYVVKKDFDILRVPATIRIEVVEIKSKNKFRNDTFEEFKNHSMLPHPNVAIYIK